MQMSRSAGFSLLEMLVAIGLAAMLLGLTSQVVQQVGASRTEQQARNRLAADATFAMRRMVTAVQRSGGLVLPLADNPATNWREHVREQSVPPAAPEGSSVAASAVLAVLQHAGADLDGNGVPDIDNDADGRLNEDPDDNANEDGLPGIGGIDDDGDGLVDEGLVDFPDDDDEDGTADEDTHDGRDDDSDGTTDEDVDKDLNGDNASGIAGVDDDGDGQVDEAHQQDDDEDGVKNEDWFEVVVFHLQNGQLLERIPVPWDENLDFAVNGGDYIEAPLLENVTYLRIERVAASGDAQLVAITLRVTDADGRELTLSQSARVGGLL